MKTLEQLNIQFNTRVLLRADFNVAIEEGKVMDGFRIKATLPTIRYLQNKKAKILILTHLGRPKEFDTELSLRPVADYLAGLLKQNIVFFQNIQEAKEGFDKIEANQIAILEN